MVHDGKPEEMFIKLTGLESVVGQTKKLNIDIMRNTETITWARTQYPK